MSKNAEKSPCAQSERMGETQPKYKNWTKFTKAQWERFKQEYDTLLRHSVTSWLQNSSRERERVLSSLDRRKRRHA